MNTSTYKIWSLSIIAMSFGLCGVNAFAIGSGQAVTQTDFEAKSSVVLFISGQDFDDGHKAGTGLCSGVLVAPDLVMTAAHCISNFVATKDKNGNDTVINGGSVGADQVFVYFELSLDLGKTIDKALLHAVKVVRSHPDFLQPGADGAGVAIHDIALIKLSQPAPVARAFGGTGPLLVGLGSAESFTFKQTLRRST